MIEPKLVQIMTEDKLNLPGLLYEAPKSKTVAIFLHGNGSSSVFYNETNRRNLPNELIKRGVSYLAFNNRGAHIIKNIDIGNPTKIKKDRKPYGTAYEIIKECILDIDAAIKFLKTLEYETFYLIGKSTGANKICVYNHYKPNNVISKYVLVCGSDDTGGYYDLLGDKLFRKMLSVSKEKVRNGNGEKLIKELIDFGIVYSYQGFYDIANPDGDYNSFPFLELLGKAKISKKELLRYFKEIRKPAFVVYGDSDEYAWGEVPKLVGILKKNKPEMDYKIIKNADHGFNGREQELAKTISNWLSDN